MKEFTAKYDGFCNECGFDIEGEVDEVCYVDDELVHALCAEDRSVSGWGSKVKVVE